MTDKIRCSCCPVCRRAPTMVIGYEQAVCGNNDCPTLMWNPTKTRDENLDDANFINLPEIFT